LRFDNLMPFCPNPVFSQTNLANNRCHPLDHQSPITYNPSPWGLFQKFSR
jgi:hypothetical protein